MKSLKTKGLHNNKVLDRLFFKAQHPSSEGASSPTASMVTSSRKFPVRAEWEVSPEKNRDIFGGFLCRA